MFESFYTLFAGLEPLGAGLLALGTLPTLITLTQTRPLAMRSISFQEAPATSADCDTLAHYRSTNLYHELPQYEISYEAKDWQLTANQHRGRVKLVHQHLHGCHLGLDARPLSTTRLTQKTLAGRVWSLYLIDPCTLHYACPIDDIAFFFNVALPYPYHVVEDGQAAQVQAAACAAEAVMDTFVLV